MCKWLSLCMTVVRPKKYTVMYRPNLQVSTHDVFQHGTLSARLTANDDYLRKVDGVVDTDGCEDILELVDESEGIR